ncbi:MAG: ABC transporter substrate-binding protein [Alphaproteobacteria bacterium]|nr:ABC transporter substrate-binding protein [Alphaproteobacteria bacterium]
MNNPTDYRLAALAAVLAGALAAAPQASAQQKELVIGQQCDRTGPTENVGVFMCPGIHDYVDLVNSKGGVEGYKIKLIDIDNQYKVPAGVEAYQREKQAGAVTMGVYGTPIVEALAQQCTTDKMSCTTPGFGIGASADGQRYPYIFPLAASYWSQAAGAVQYAKDQLGGSLKGKKIAYLMYDNPAGREPLPVLKDLATSEGYELKVFAVPPPGLDVTSQALDIAQRFRADFVIAHVFGRSPAVAIKALKGNGYPLRKVVGLVWASAEADIEAAGGFGVAEGYNTMQFAGVGSDYPVNKEIVAMYAKEGKPPSKEMKSTVYYNRGIAWGALEVEAIRNAIKAKNGGVPSSDDVKRGFEQIHDFTLGGLLPPLKVTPEDHEGGGFVQIWQVKGGKLVRQTDWFHAFPEVVKKQVMASANKS